MVNTESILIKSSGFIGAVVFLMVLSSSALASCTLVPGVAITRSVSFGTVIVQRDSPVGTVLATANTGAYYGGAQFYGCTIPFVHRVQMETFKVISSHGNSVYSTNIDGVGVRIRTPSQRYVPYDIYFAAPTNFYIDNIVVQLVKTKPGAVGAGVLTNGHLTSAGIVNYFYAAYASLVGVNTIVPVACTISNIAIPVPMGTVPRNMFNGLGSVGNEVSFSIPLNCDANTRIKLPWMATPIAQALVGCWH